MDEEGLRIDLTEEALKRLADEGRRAKLLYLIPTHQNPVGSTLPLDRRERLIELSREHRVPLMEDDAYGELWLGDEPPPPSLFSLSGGELAIKVASFSKIIATGLRLGWNLAPPAFITRMAALRYDMGSSPYLGRIVAEMIRNGDLDRHVDRLRGIYRRKLDRLCAAIDEHCDDYVSYLRPEGGFFLWLALRPGLSAAGGPARREREGRADRRRDHTSSPTGTRHNTCGWRSATRPPRRSRKASTVWARHCTRSRPAPR